MAKILNDSKNSFLKNINNFNIDPSGVKSYNKTEGIQDPTYVGFNLKFSFNNDDYRNFPGGVTGTQSIMTGLLLSSSDIDSSYNFLIRRNKAKNAMMLNEFRTQLKNIQENKSWYFKSVSGLNELMKKPVAGETWRGKDKTLTIECIESFDFQINFLADLYRKATYDMEFRRNLLPTEKRAFNLNIIITEVRNLFEVERILDEMVTEPKQANSPISQFLGGSSVSKSTGFSFLNTTTELQSNIKGADVTKAVLPNRDNNGNIDSVESQEKVINKYKHSFRKLNDLLTFYIFKLYDCEFIFDDYPFLETIDNSNMAPEPVTSKFQIVVGDLIEYNQYGYYEWILTDSDIAVPDNYENTSNLNWREQPKVGSFKDTKNNWQYWTHPDDYATLELNAAKTKREDALEKQEKAILDQQEASAFSLGGVVGLETIKLAKEQGQKMVGQELTKIKNKYIAQSGINVNLLNDIANDIDNLSLLNPMLALDIINKTKKMIENNKGKKKSDENKLKNQNTINEMDNPYNSTLSKKTSDDLLYVSLRKDKSFDITHTGFKNIGDGTFYDYGSDTATNKDIKNKKTIDNYSDSHTKKYISNNTIKEYPLNTFKKNENIYQTSTDTVKKEDTIKTLNLVKTDKKDRITTIDIDKQNVNKQIKDINIEPLSKKDEITTVDLIKLENKKTITNLELISPIKKTEITNSLKVEPLTKKTTIN